MRCRYVGAISHIAWRTVARFSGRASTAPLTSDAKIVAPGSTGSDIGRNDSTRSPRPSPNAWIVAAVAAAMLPWVITTPRGSPVVPLV